MADKDLYKILGVPRTASVQEIKKAYRKLARDLHPDRNPGNKKAEDRFKDVAYAKDVLLDEKKRNLYNEFGEAGLKEGFNANAYRQYKAWQQQGGGGAAYGGIEDIFAGARGGGGGGGFRFNLDDLVGEGGIGDLFGIGGRSRRRGPTRGHDLQSEITISFVEAIRGTERELKLAAPGDKEPRTIKVRIPPGAENGGKIRLRGQGGAANGGEPGDLVLTVHVESHPFFKREGHDLHVDLPVTIPEAWQGAKVQVPTPHGNVSLRIPPRTQSGARLRLKGKGVPNRKGSPGDLIVEVLTRLPDGNEERITTLVEQLATEYRRDLRADLRL